MNLYVKCDEEQVFITNVAYLNISCIDHHKKEEYTNSNGETAVYDVRICDITLHVESTDFIKVKIEFKNLESYNTNTLYGIIENCLKNNITTCFIDGYKFTLIDKKTD